MEEWKTYAFGPASGATPEKIVLMLHGLGSNGEDLISLAPYLAKEVPNAIFLSPDAPQPCDMAPYGRQWFSLRSYDPDFILNGVRETAPLLNDYIDQVLAQFGLQDSDLVLLGFSQGTMMSLYTAPRRRNAIAGVIGYSGALIGGDELTGPGIQKIPVCLIHGEADQVVPLERFHAAKSGLEGAGFTVDTLSTPGLVHSIDDAGIQRGAAFLKKVFAR